MLPTQQTKQCGRICSKQTCRRGRYGFQNPSKYKQHMSWASYAHRKIRNEAFDARESSCAEGFAGSARAHPEGKNVRLASESRQHSPIRDSLTLSSFASSSSQPFPSPWPSQSHDSVTEAAAAFISRVVLDRSPNRVWCLFHVLPSLSVARLCSPKLAQGSHRFSPTKSR